MNHLPSAKTGMTDDIRRKVLRICTERGLAGAANNTKWDKLVSAIRNMDEWRPSYRCKVIDGGISSWDTEWFYHLPFPLIYIEWLDIGMHQETNIGRLAKPKVTDHSEWIIPLIENTGFEYQVSGDIMRVFAYLPKNLEDFPPSA